MDDFGGKIYGNSRRAFSGRLQGKQAAFKSWIQSSISIFDIFYLATLLIAPSLSRKSTSLIGDEMFAHDDIMFSAVKEIDTGIHPVSRMLL